MIVLDFVADYLFGLLRITRAPITPGIQPHKVKINMITIEPQPLSITAKGGNKMDKMTLKMLIWKDYLIIRLKYERIVTV